MTRTALYRAYDDAGDLLYVGISNNWAKRLDQHTRTAQWAQHVARTTVTYYPTRQDALNAERHAIQTEHPRHNIFHVAKPPAPTPKPPKPRPAYIPSPPPTEPAFSATTMAAVAAVFKEALKREAVE